jgi:hypothetical protein
MAGLVAGAVTGVYKEAQIIPVKIADDKGKLQVWLLMRGAGRSSNRSVRDG